MRQCARQPAGHRAGKRRWPRRSGRRGWGGRRRAGPGPEEAGARAGWPGPSATSACKVRCSGDRSRSPQLSASGLAKAELACPQLSSNDGLLERSPRPAPPGRLEDQPLLLRAFCKVATHDCRAPGDVGLLARARQEGKAPAGVVRPGRGRWAPSVQPGRSRRERDPRPRVQESLLPERQTKARMCDPHLPPHSVSCEFGFHFPREEDRSPLRQNKNKRSK